MAAAAADLTICLQLAEKNGSLGKKSHGFSLYLGLILLLLEVRSAPATHYGHHLFRVSKA